MARQQPGTPALTRRGLVLAGAAAAAALPLRETQAQAQVTISGDWLTMVRQHHDMIERAFDELLEPATAPWENRNLQVRTLEQLINAHSLAEETVLYPAMARAGMEDAARELYLDEANIDILKARLVLATRVRDANGEWRATATQLRRVLLTHAIEEEEQRWFPQLAQALEPLQNRVLSELYAAHFASVMPVRYRVGGPVTPAPAR